MKIESPRTRTKFIDPVPTALIRSAPNLTHLDLRDCYEVSDVSLKAIGSSGSISYLKLERCLLITDGGLGFLGDGSISKTLKTLILHKLVHITDDGLLHLKKMHCLERLGLASTSSSPYITDIGVVAISGIRTLRNLRLDLSHNMSDRTVDALSQNCPNLEILHLCSYGITRAGIRAFSGHARIQTMVMWRHHEVEASDLEHLVLNCGSLKCVLLDGVSPYRLTKIISVMQKQTRRVVRSGSMNCFTLFWTEIGR